MAEIDKVSWQDIDSLSRQLAKKINRRFDAIICIMRGGAIPGAILANELEIERVLSIKVTQKGQINLNPKSNDNPAHYKGCRSGIIVPLNNLNIEGFDILVVDDVLDSGESARQVVKEVYAHGARDVKLASLHIKTYSSFIPDYYVEEKSNWLFYPWMSQQELKQMYSRLTSVENAMTTL